MSLRSKRALSLTACGTALAVMVLVGFRYVLPRVGLAEQPPVRLGTIERANKADRQRRVAAASADLDTLTALHALAEAGTRPLNAADIAAHRAYLQNGAVSVLPPASLPPLATATPERKPEPPADRSAGAKPSPTSGDRLSLLPLLPPVKPALPDPASVAPGGIPRLSTAGEIGRGEMPAGRPDPVPLGGMAAQDITGSIGNPHFPLPETDGAEASGLSEERTFSAIEVIDGRTFRASGLTVRLVGVTLPRVNRLCQKIDGTTELCTERARTRLDLITRHRPIHCLIDGSAANTILNGRCKLGTADLSAWMTREGWVVPSENDDSLAPALAEAKRIRAGIWR